MTLKEKRYTPLHPRKAPIYYKEEDVKEAVLEFQKKANDEMWLNYEEEDRKFWNDLINEIFGDFKEE